jgi:hypothetical protein
MFANMLASCPSGMEQTDHHVPVHVPAALTCHSADFQDQEPGDIRRLASRADKLCATHIQQSHDFVANVEAAED